MIKFKKFITLFLLISFLLFISVFTTGCKDTFNGVKKFLSGFSQMLKNIFDVLYSKISSIINKNNSTPVPGTTPAEAGTTVPPDMVQSTPRPDPGAPDFISTWGEEGVKPGQFNSPLGIAVDYEGFVYVADTNNSRIQKFSPEGKFINAYGKRGSDIGELDKPYALAITDIGDIYISDNQNSRIVKIDGQGQFLSAKCNDGAQIGELHQPIGLTFDQEGNLFVADSGNHRIQKLNYEGLQNNTAYNKIETKQPGMIITPDNTWNKKFPLHNEGPNAGEFTTPWGVALSPAGDVIIVDTCNHRLQKFSPEGDFIKQWGQVGSDRGQFQFPTFAVIDQFGFILVADTGNNRIQKFDMEGNFKAQWGSPGYDKGQFNHPHGIAVSMNSGDVFITDTENNRIQRYSYSGSWTVWWQEHVWKKKTPAPENPSPAANPTEVIF